jgi:hypothetical protein
LLTQFYGARQEKDEDISHWSCRLERIIGKCVDEGLVHRSEVDQQLHFMLWNGLKCIKCETKRNETKSTKTKRNETKSTK